MPETPAWGGPRWGFDGTPFEGYTPHALVGGFRAVAWVGLYCSVPLPARSEPEADHKPINHLLQTQYSMHSTFRLPAPARATVINSNHSATTLNTDTPQGISAGGPYRREDGEGAVAHAAILGTIRVLSNGQLKDTFGTASLSDCERIKERKTQVTSAILAIL